MAQTLPTAAVAQTMSFSKAGGDLTHTLGEDFPTVFGEKHLKREPMFTYAKDKFNIFRWHLVEHTGTHIDSPFHFTADGPSVDKRAFR